MIGEVLTISKLAIDLFGVGRANPDLRIFINRAEFNPGLGGCPPFVAADITLTNISTSAYSISALSLNGTEPVLSPGIRTDNVGGRYIEKYEDDLAPAYLGPETSIPHIKPLPDTPYLQSRESIRGLVFWEGNFAGEKLILSTTILSEKREISAEMRLPVK